METANHRVSWTINNYKNQVDDQLLRIGKHVVLEQVPWDMNWYIGKYCLITGHQYFQAIAH